MVDRTDVAPPSGTPLEVTHGDRLPEVIDPPPRVVHEPHEATSAARNRQQASKWPLLSGLPGEQARAVLVLARRRRFARGDILFHEGDPGDTLHLIDRGHLAVRVTTPLGDTATLRVLGPGDVVGELSVVSPAPRNATVVALDAVQTLGLHRDQFDELRSSHPAIDAVLLEALIGEVRRLSAQLLEALYVPVTKRVMHRLTELAGLYAPAAGRTGEAPVIIPLTQDDIAGLSGTTRPTANQVLQKLAEQGVVEVGRGRISVLDQERLRRLGH